MSAISSGRPKRPTGILLCEISISLRILPRGLGICTLASGEGLAIIAVSVEFEDEVSAGLGGGGVAG